MVIQGSLCPNCNSARLGSRLEGHLLFLDCSTCGWDYYPPTAAPAEIVEKIVYKDRVVHREKRITPEERRRITIEELEKTHARLLKDRERMQKEHDKIVLDLQRLEFVYVIAQIYLQKTEQVLEE